MARIKKKYKLMPLYWLDGNWTKVCNTMIFYVPDAYAFKIYVYLCYRYNDQYDYAFPSLNTIANDTNISKRKVQESIKWLEQKKFIVKIGYSKETGTACYRISFVNEELNDDLKCVETLPLISRDEDEVVEYYKDEDDLKCVETLPLISRDEDDLKTNKNKSRKSDYAYIKWRNNVLNRDNYTCQLCGKTKDETILNVHHIERYVDNEELRSDVSNGITLCYECHKKVFNREEEFEEYFKQLISAMRE